MRSRSRRCAWSRGAVREAVVRRERIPALDGQPASRSAPDSSTTSAVMSFVTDAIGTARSASRATSTPRRPARARGAPEGDVHGGERERVGVAGRRRGSPAARRRSRTDAEQENECAQWGNGAFDSTMARCVSTLSRCAADTGARSSPAASTRRPPPRRDRPRRSAGSRLPQPKSPTRSEDARRPWVGDHADAEHEADAARVEIAEQGSVGRSYRAPRRAPRDDRRRVRDGRRDSRRTPSCRRRGRSISAKRM